MASFFVSTFIFAQNAEQKKQFETFFNQFKKEQAFQKENTSASLSFYTFKKNNNVTVRQNPKNKPFIDFTNYCPDKKNPCKTEVKYSEEGVSYKILSPAYTSTFLFKNNEKNKKIWTLVAVYLHMK